jgi:uncharacterized repeat protein (TIGR01451 family)
MKHLYLLKTLTIITAFLIADPDGAIAQSASQTFSTPGTYTFTVPSAVTSITVQAWGGGGGARGDGTDRRGGGGGGAYASSIIPVTTGQTYTVVVGTGGISTSNPGQSGQSSTFGNNLVVAAGGTGGSNDGGAGGTVAASIGTIRYAGGTGGTRGDTGGGGGGGSALTTGNGGNGANGSGSVGGAGGIGTGNGGAGGNSGQSGNEGLAPGGGGGGRGTNGPVSGNGAAGRVVVSWVSVAADLAVTKTASVSQVFVGQTVAFTITATNNGPANASNVVVEDLLPSGYTFFSASLSSSTASYNQSTGRLTIGTLNSGNSVVMTLVGIVNPSGVYTNTASVAADQPDLISGNNSASATVNVCRAGSSSPNFN